MKEYKIEAGQSSVNPIRDQNDLYNCINYFKKLRDNASTEIKRHQYDRNYMLFLLGINTALRFSDLRTLTVEKVKDNYIYLREKKTKKEIKITLHSDIYKEVMEYIKRNNLYKTDYLFQSGKGYNQPLTRIMGYKIMQKLKKIVRSLTISEHIL